MYYVYEKNFDDGRTVAFISKNPAYDSRTGDSRCEGWCGFDEDNAETYAHGVYETIEQASEAVEMIFGKTRFYFYMPNKIYEKGVVAAYDVTK